MLHLSTLLLPLLIPLSLPLSLLLPPISPSLILPHDNSSFRLVYVFLLIYLVGIMIYSRLVLG